MQTKALQSVSLAALALALAACTSVQPTRTGFLDSSLSLTVEDGKQHLLSAHELEATWSADDTYVLEPVAYRPSGDARSPETAQALQQHFEQELRTALGRTWKPAAKGESSAVKVRAAVTDIETVNPFLNGFSVALSGLPFDNGGASVELELLDPRGHVLYRLSGAETGTVFQFWKGLSRNAFARSSLTKLARHVGEHVDQQVRLAGDKQVRP
jgi:Protein of unknown function (DUF3313)